MSHPAPSPSVLTISRRYLMGSAAGHDDRTVVWIEGDFDLASNAALASALHAAQLLGEADLIVDLSRVQFFSVSTLKVMADLRELLMSQGRGLVLRDPAPCCRTVFELCGFGALLEPRPSGTSGRRRESALSSWVAVPHLDRDAAVDDAVPLMDDLDQIESYADSVEERLVSMAVRQLVETRAARLDRQSDG